jgi:hypothetical protein
MGITEIKRLNLKDGDILFVPISDAGLEHLMNDMRKAFPGVRALIVGATSETIAGIKVVSVAEVNKK